MKRSELIVKTSKSLFEHGFTRNICNNSDGSWYFRSGGSRVKVGYSNSLQEVTWEHYDKNFFRPTDVGIGTDSLKNFLNEGNSSKESVYRIEELPNKSGLSQYKVYGPKSKYPVLISYDEQSDTWKGYNYGRDSNNLLGDDHYVSIVKRWKKIGKPTGTSAKVVGSVDRQYSGYEGPRFWNSQMPVGIPDKRTPFR